MVAGSAAVLGVGKRVWDAFRQARFDGSSYRVKFMADKNEAVKEFNRSRRVANCMNYGSVAIPTGMGMEAAYTSSAPLANNYFVEGMSDLGSAAAGFGLGYIAIPIAIMAAQGIAEGVSYVFRKR